jgi:hypothetical protein
LGEVAGWGEDWPNFVRTQRFTGSVLPRSQNKLRVCTNLFIDQLINNESVERKMPSLSSCSLHKSFLNFGGWACGMPRNTLRAVFCSNGVLFTGGAVQSALVVHITLYM